MGAGVTAAAGATAPNGLAAGGAEGADAPSNLNMVEPLSAAAGAGTAAAGVSPPPKMLAAGAGALVSTAGLLLPNNEDEVVSAAGTPNADADADAGAGVEAGAGRDPKEKAGAAAVLGTSAVVLVDPNRLLPLSSFLEPPELELKLELELANKDFGASAVLSSWGFAGSSVFFANENNDGAAEAAGSSFLSFVSMLFEPNVEVDDDEPNVEVDDDEIAELFPKPPKVDAGAASDFVSDAFAKKEGAGEDVAAVVVGAGAATGLFGGLGFVRLRNSMDTCESGLSSFAKSLGGDTTDLAFSLPSLSAVAALTPKATFSGADSNGLAFLTGASSVSSTATF